MKNIDNTTENLEGLAKKMESLGWRLTVGITLPIILFILGLFMMPLGIIAWILALILFINSFTKK